MTNGEFQSKIVLDRNLNAKDNQNHATGEAANRGVHSLLGGNPSHDEKDFQDFGAGRVRS
jgi:hypothetical protein